MPYRGTSSDLAPEAERKARAFTAVPAHEVTEQPEPAPPVRDTRGGGLHHLFYPVQTSSRTLSPRQVACT